MEFTSNVKSRDGWKLMSWYKGVRRQTAPPLNRPDGTMAITPEEKADTLFGFLFQPPPELGDEPGVDLVLPGHNTRNFVDVTEGEVNKALNVTSNASAPGRSGIGYRALKWVWVNRPREILLVMQLGLRLGVHRLRRRIKLMIARCAGSNIPKKLTRFILLLGESGNAFVSKVASQVVDDG
jgi:hypothetical protein